MAQKQSSAKATIIRKLNTYILFYKVAIADDNHTLAAFYKKKLEKLQDEAKSISVDVEYNEETGRFRLKDREIKESESILVSIYHDKIRSIVETKVNAIETEKLRLEDRIGKLIKEAQGKRLTVDDSHYIVSVTEMQNSISKCEMQKEVLYELYEKIQRIFE